MTSFYDVNISIFKQCFNIYFTGVGKTSMVVRYVGKMFSTHISPTIGASFFTCKINIGDAKVKLQVFEYVFLNYYILKHEQFPVRY